LARLLDMLVAKIDWIFLMDFHERSFSVVDFLPEPNGLFVCVHFLKVSGSPAHFARNVKPVKPAVLRNRAPVRDGAVPPRVGEPFE
jgi:hypothetical protein